MNVMVLEEHWLRRMRLKWLVKRAIPQAKVLCLGRSKGMIAYARMTYFDVVFLDMNNQQAQKLQMVRKLQHLCPRINIIFMTDEKDNDLAKTGFDIHISGFIVQPATKERVVKEFQNLRYKATQ